MAGKSGKDLEQIGFWARQIDKVKHPSFKFLSAATEIPEEMYQGISTEQGKEKFYKTLYPEFQERTLYSYLSDPHIWEQGFWGLIGGVTMNSLVGAYNTISTRRKAKKNPDTYNKLKESHLIAMNKPEVKEKMRKSHLGKKLPEEVKQKLREASYGKNTWSKGRTYYTNGKMNVCAFVCPEGFHKGRTLRKDMN
jgi:hypothetical protein